MLGWRLHMTKEFIANIKTKNALVFFMLTMMLSLIVGCEGGGSGSDARLPVHMTGDIPDDLADEIYLEFCQADPEAIAPFLISDVD